MKTTQSKTIQKLLLSTVIGITALVFTNCKKENQLVPDSGQGVSLQRAQMSLSAVDSTSYDLRKSLPIGFVTDGSIDYTTYVQAALVNNKNITFPSFPILINDSGLTISSNTTITFSAGSELRMKPTANFGYNMLTMRNATNVTLINPVLIGDRYKHLGTTGEWGMGIAIYGGSNITVISPKAKEMWGDGIYIGVEDKVIPENITIKDAVLEYNRRDGISISAVNGLVLESPYAAFSNATKPMAGIAFEPNNNTQEIKNVKINNPKTRENSGAGIFVDFGNLMGGGQKKVDVTITNHEDFKSYWGVKAMSRISDGISTIQGDLKLINPKWNQCTFKSISTALYGVNDVHLIIENSVIRNISDIQLTKDQTVAYLNSKLQINPSAWRSITFGAYWPSLTAPVVAVIKDNTPVYAINVGGDSYTAANGVVYSADKYFSGGSIYKTVKSIANTADSVLYQSERNGTFSYNLPVTNGTYEVTLKFAELYHSAIGRRVFDTLVEGNEVISDLDLFSVTGKNVAYDVVKTVSVTDGVLNLKFIKNINNATIGAFQVVKK